MNIQMREITVHERSEIIFALTYSINGDYFLRILKITNWKTCNDIHEGTV